ncbi:MAG: Pantothenate synthetase [Ferruginibacter sp.]|nr:Pantothenate synthetase [Ferruginibacter sp.]
MILIKTIQQARNLLGKQQAGGSSIGFVPTMGALHNGHMSLIKTCLDDDQYCVCSIFVNPTQFNNPSDFARYPVTIEKDIRMLEAAGCNMLFLPSVEEMYPAGYTALHYDLGYLETILEGEFRPGHFQGVCQIVDKLLAVVAPDKLYMGQKDYQQCMVIKKMINLRGYSTELKIQPTIRETSGLAMSSRNMRLDDEAKAAAITISQVLFQMKENLRAGDLASLKQNARQRLEQQGFTVDYVEIADANDLQIVNAWDGSRSIVALLAAFLGEVRLIDNLVLS